jgi:hypothetical protein
LVNFFGPPHFPITLSMSGTVPECRACMSGAHAAHQRREVRMNHPWRVVRQMETRTTARGQPWGNTFRISGEWPSVTE